MALLARLFSPRKTYKKDKDHDSPNVSSLSRSRTFGFPLDTNQTRVLLFRECDWRGRKLLFDSTSVEKTPLDPNLPRPRCNSSDMVVEVSSGYSYKYKKPHADINTLGETIFGSIAMVTRGLSMKVHLMKDPARLMFSKIIQAPRSGVRKRQISDDKMLGDSQGSSVNSMGERNSGSFSSKSVAGSFEATLDDSGIVSLPLSADWCQHSTPPQPYGCSSCPLHPSGLSLESDSAEHGNSSSSMQSGGSLSSLRRRWVRSVATSLNVEDPAQPVAPTGKRTKLAVAIIIPLCESNSEEMEQFLLDRLPLVNNILTRLQHSTERAYCRREVFVQSMCQASAHATQSLCQLVGGPRLDRPLWLTMTGDAADCHRSELEHRLMTDISQLLTTLDTKHTNFFISTLLTAVLTHHLGWVPTVMPDMPQHSGILLAELSKNHPYSALWAQLSDLQGALGYPPKVAKTVVVGKSQALVLQLLSVLSYFIRCGHVKQEDLQREIPPEEENRLEDLLDDRNNKSFDKDAIREFSKAGSLDGRMSSTSTLTKSKTVLSMKTFSVQECDLDNANSLESGFESCNEFSGESYEDGNKILKAMHGLEPKFVKSKSSAKLMETSFSENHTTDLNTISSGGMKMSLDSPDSSFVKCIETDFKVIKMESEKQFTSPYVLDVMNRTNSKHLLHCENEKSNSFIKENLIQSELKEPEDKASKVVFVLGENEQLVNIKGQDEANVCAQPPNETHLPPPIILVNDTNPEYFSIQDEESENKYTEFVAGDISDRVVISHSTAIRLEDAKEVETLRPLQRQRCLSAPEEAVIKSDWIKKRRRSKDMIHIIRKWLSDSAIQRTSNQSLHRMSSNENVISSTKESVLSDAGVFRTRNRTLNNAVKKPSLSVENVVSQIGCDSLNPKVDPVSPSPSNEYVELPFSSSVVEGRGRVVGVAASMFGSVGSHYCPELVLQGLSGVAPGWLADLRLSLALEAHSADLGGDGGEAVCIVADVDACEVQLVTSGSARSVRVGMSQLVANMLESTQQLCALSLPPPVCLTHVEAKLQELCVRSQALAELLLSTEFLDMASLTSALDLDPNDVPLLLSVASTHTPSVTHKYGLSYQ